VKYEYAHLVRAVIHKKLWIGRVVHALTVALFGLIHALTVAVSRINGRAPNKYLYVPVTNTSFSRSCAYWGQVCDLPPKRLALATNSHLKEIHENRNRSQ
jgi:bacteriorhodopsin